MFDRNPKAFLHANTGYLKWGSRKLGRKLGITTEEALELQRLVKNELRSSNESTSVNTHGYEYAPDEEDLDPNNNDLTYEQFLSKRGIEKKDVVSVKHWQTMKGYPRYSVVQRTDLTGGIDIEKAFLNNLKNYVVPCVIPPGPERTTPRVGIINLFDAHIDKIAVPAEVYGAKGLSLQENFDLLEEKFDEALEAMSYYSPEKIYFPIGSDFWTTNGPNQGTRKGTPQRTQNHHEEAFEMGVNFYRRCIDKLSQITDKVVLLTLKGNHDEDPVFYLGMLMKAVYNGSTRVEVHATRHQRKYFQEGIWGFGFGHGDKEKRKLDRLPLFFAQEAPQLWAATTMREMFFGDVHHTKEYKFQRARDGVGMYAYFLRSTNEADLWHSDEGWIGIPKSIYAFIYDKDSGRKKNITISW